MAVIIIRIFDRKVRSTFKFGKELEVEAFYM